MYDKNITETVQLEKKSTVSFFNLWRQFLPLSLSDVTMALADPMINSTLAHLPTPQSNLAAVGIAKSQAIFFESPIIMILHASNVLAKSLTSRKALWRFVLIITFLLSACLLILTIPFIFNLFSHTVLGIDGEILVKSRSVLLILFLWPFFIGWRRFYQGILIYYNHGDELGLASLTRIILVAIILGLGLFFKDSISISSHQLAAFALIGGVLCEAIFVTLVAKKHHLLLPLRNNKNDPLNMHDLKVDYVQNLPHTIRGVAKFYWPLASSMLLVWGARALLVGIIARAIDGPIALAAWPMAWGLVLVIGNATRMVQQVIIKNKDLVDQSMLYLFAASVGSFFSLLILLMGSTTTGQYFLNVFVGNNPSLASRVSYVILICSSVPLLIALQNSFQGFLIAEGKTQYVNLSTWMGSSALMIITIACVYFKVEGATSAAIGMVISLFFEIIFLFYFINKLSVRKKNIK